MSGPDGWDRGVWSRAPEHSETRGDTLLVTAVQGSDAWRHTSYGFLRDGAHALLAPFRDGAATEVELTVAFSAQFDQAGVLVRVSAEHWVKAGVEQVDGVPHVGAVVTDGRSDWSVAPVPEWAGRRVLVRVSWTGDALTVRAGVADGPPRLVRVLPFTPAGPVAAGPYVCAPSRAGLTVAFHAWRDGEADARLH